MKRLVLAIGFTALPVVVTAQVTGIRSSSFVPVIPSNRVTNRLAIDTLGDMLELQIVLNATPNSVYQNGAGATNGPSFYCPPNADCGDDAPANPAIGLDSYVTLGTFDFFSSVFISFRYHDAFYFRSSVPPSKVLGPASSLPASSASVPTFDTSRLDIAWGPNDGLVTGPVNNLPIAQITLRNTAEGTLHYYARAAGGEAWIGSAPVVAGVIQLSVPEPNAALLVASAISAFAARRR
jgi:hypothetical protein